MVLHEIQACTMTLSNRDWKEAMVTCKSINIKQPRNVFAMHSLDIATNY